MSVPFPELPPMTGPWCVGIDLSGRSVDIVRLHESHDYAERGQRVLTGATAFDRLLDIEMPSSGWWSDVYLAAIEMPESRFRVSLRAQLPVYGAVCARIPSSITLWSVSPADWKRPLALGAKKPTAASFPPELAACAADWPQDALDALGVALYARDENARGIAAALNPPTGKAAA